MASHLTFIEPGRNHCDFIDISVPETWSPGQLIAEGARCGAILLSLLWLVGFLSILLAAVTAIVIIFFLHKRLARSILCRSLPVPSYLTVAECFDRAVDRALVQLVRVDARNIERILQSREFRIWIGNFDERSMTVKLNFHQPWYALEIIAGPYATFYRNPSISMPIFDPEEFEPRRRIDRWLLKFYPDPRQITPVMQPMSMRHIRYVKQLSAHERLALVAIGLKSATAAA